MDVREMMPLKEIIARFTSAKPEGSTQDWIKADKDAAGLKR